MNQPIDFFHVFLGYLMVSIPGRSEVQTLHVEWNRVELPLEASSAAKAMEAHHWSEIDEVQRGQCSAPWAKQRKHLKCIKMH